MVRSTELAITISYLTSASGIIVLLKTPRPIKLQYLSLPAVFVDARSRLRCLWSMVYELIYHWLLTNQNSGIAIYHVFHVLQIRRKILAISRCCFAENGQEMYQDPRRTYRAIILLIESFKPGSHLPPTYLRHSRRYMPGILVSYYRYCRRSGIEIDFFSSEKVRPGQAVYLTH